MTLHKEFNALIEATQYSIPQLHDNTIYILSGTEEWDIAIANLQNSIETAKSRAFWHYWFKVERLGLNEVSLPDNIRLLFEAGYNVIMPLYTPDAENKSYMLCKVKEPAHLEFCVAFMMIDAQNIQDQSSMNAFVQLYNEDKEKAFEEWSKSKDSVCAQPFNVASVSFRGKYSSKQSKYPFLQHEYDIPKNLRNNYEERLSRIMGISKTVKSLNKPQNDLERQTAENDFQVVCEGLRESEKNELILELSKAIPEDKLKEIWQTVTDRKAKGQNCKVGIEVRSKLPVLDNGHPDRLQGDIRTYMVDRNGKHHLLNFANNTSNTIYVMNMLFYKRNKGELRVLDIRKNKDAFVKFYNIIYPGDKSGESAFDKLMCRVSKTEYDYEGRAKSRCFNSIVNCITEKCRQLGVNSSPYIVNDELPPTFDYNLIKFAPNLEEELSKIVFNV